MKPCFFFLFLFLQGVLCQDYSQNGRNWLDEKCASGVKQSPVNIDTQSL